MAEDEWVRARAREIVGRGREPNTQQTFTAMEFSLLVAGIATFGQSALYFGKRNILDRLRNPDEAMLDAIVSEMIASSDRRVPVLKRAEWRERARPFIRALAAHLDEKEKAGG